MSASALTKNLRAFLAAQWFSGAVLGLFALAWLAPHFAHTINLGGWTANSAIMLTFLVLGLSLKTEEAVTSLRNWKLHLFINSFSFLLMPGVAWAAMMLWGDRLPEGLVLGMYVLAVVPTTITSCVIFTQLAGGNFAGTLFNSVGGNMLGVFVSPLLMTLLLGTTDLRIELAIASTFYKLCLIVLLPFVGGQLAHRAVIVRYPGFRRIASQINRYAILLIIYMAFGDLFVRQSDTGVAASQLLIPLALLIPVQFGLIALAYFGSRALKFAWPDTIAIVYCAPQKTLALGVPLTLSMLAKRPDLVGLALLPLLVYHPVQLILSGILEPPLRRRSLALADQRSTPVPAKPSPS